jgi:glyoxalase family protein
VAFAIPGDALDAWGSRLARAGVETVRTAGAFGEDVLGFCDPDGLPLALVAGPDTAQRALWTPWPDGPVPAEMAIRGLHSVVVQEAGPDPTAQFLTGVLGFRLVAEAGGTLRFATGEGGSGTLLDLRPHPGGRPGRIGAGTVHHVAWRTPGDAEQRAWWTRIRRVAADLSPIIDRFWFRSIYFHEPGGVLFEIATDGPGFAADEPTEALGSRLVLPPWLEAQRERIEAALPPLRLPAAGVATSGTTS